MYYATVSLHVQELIVAANTNKSQKWHWAIGKLYKDPRHKPSKTRD